MRDRWATAASWILVCGVVVTPLVTLVAARSVLSPGLPIPNEPDRVGALYIFWVMSIALVGAVVGRRDFWLGTFVILNAMWIALFPTSTVITSSVILVLLGALIFYASLDISEIWIKKSLALVVILTIPFSAIQLAGYDIFDRVFYTHPSSLYGNPFVYGSFLAIVAPLFIRNIIIIILIGFGILASQSWLAIVAATIGCLVALKPKLLITLAAVISLSIIAIISPKRDWITPLGDRIIAWHGATRYLRKFKWIFGQGPGAYYWLGHNIQGGDKMSGVYVQAHNEYLQLVFDYGVLGLICLAGFLFSRRWSFDIQTGAIVSLAIVSLFGFPFRTALTATPTIMILSLWARKSYAKVS